MPDSTDQLNILFQVILATSADVNFLYSNQIMSAARSSIFLFANVKTLRGRQYNLVNKLLFGVWVLQNWSSDAFRTLPVSLAWFTLKTKRVNNKDERPLKWRSLFITCLYVDFVFNYFTVSGIKFVLDNWNLLTLCLQLTLYTHGFDLMLHSK